ncbi:MAG: MotA/TolQ/ExbB proton channel family protein [Victivallaceae bacterium]|nr:MotA/TolQ/ExbB proton channel family protein [Victivallaceae bacterium]
MKMSKCKQLWILILVGVILSFLAPGGFSQTADEKIGEARVLEQKLNSEKVKSALLRRRPLPVAGGFWGFVVWVLLLLNAIFFLGAAAAAWCFIRRHRTYPKELVHRVKTVLYDGELGFAMEACAPCKTPLSRILFSAFKNIADGFEVCKDEMYIALKAEYERMLKTTRLLLNCAVYSSVLGLLGFGAVVILALKDFSVNSRPGNWQELAYAGAQSFFPLMTGLITAYIAFWFYQYCVGKINRIIINTEKIAYDLIKFLRGIHLEDELPDLPTMTRLLNPRSIVSLPKNKIVTPKKNISKQG